MTRVNLLPGWVKRQRVIDWRLVALAVALVAAAGTAGFEHYVTAQEIAAVYRETERVRHEQTLLRPKLEQRDALIARRQVMEHKRDFLAGVIARRWAAILRELAALTPPNLQLARIEFVEPGELVLTGSTAHLEPIAQLMAGLDRSALLSRARARYARDEEGLYDFEVRAHIR
ncbi:MAG TPA: PilN domain-containing protein [Bacillota bacterium]|nr:PilN domain-containing protein [Bacillota bacterium]